MRNRVHRRAFAPARASQPAASPARLTAELNARFTGATKLKQAGRLNLKGLEYGK